MPAPTSKRYAPIKLLSIETEGFSYFSRQDILIHEGLTGLIGENGSGKTTFLNMVRVLFGAVRFDNDHSLRTFFEREDIFEIYIIGKFDNNFNPNCNIQPFEHIGKKNNIVSIICRLQLNDPTVKRNYIIYDGDFDLDKDMKNNLRWLEVKQYLSQMEEIGISSALIRAFSLNQGNTEEVLKKNEEDLAEYLLDICGEQERIDNFRKVKTEVIRQKQQFSALSEQKNMEEAHVQRLQERIERCKQILLREQTKEKFKFDLPIALVIESREKFEKAKVKLQESEITLKELVDSIQSLQEKERLSQDTYSALETGYKKNLQDLNSLYDEKSKSDTDLAILDKDVTEIEKFLSEYGEVKPISESQLEKQKAADESLYLEAFTQFKEVEKNKKYIEETIQRLDQNGSIEYPTEVQRMITKLKECEVEHLLVADYIDILDEKWREAIEALIGPERFTITVSEDHIVKVMKWAQELKYPYWISPFKSIKFTVSADSILQKVKILDERISGYLEKFRDYMISETMEKGWNWVKKGKNSILNTPYPYKIISRGGRFIKSNGKYCGKEAFHAQLKDAQQQLDVLLPSYNSFKDKMEQAKLNYDKTLEMIEIQKNVRMIPNKQAIHEKLIIKQKNTQEHLSKIQNQLNEEQKKQNVLFTQLDSLRGEIGKVQGQIEEKQKHKESIVIDIRQQEQFVHESHQNYVHALEGLSAEQKSLANNEEYTADLSPSAYYKTEIESLTQTINVLRNITKSDFIAPGEEKRLIGLEQKYKHHQKLVQNHIKEIKRVQIELSKLEEKHKIAEQEYHMMVEQVFSKIKKSLEDLSKISNIKADLRAFHIGEERWKVDYRIAFHGKELQSYRVKAGLSGGQKVIASLLLTFAAVKSDGALSFMILDEPFAHLDQERINVAGEFLKKTGVQFLIAMPYSENIKLLMPWVNMIINFRPKRVNEEVAPPITYGVVNDEYLRKRSVI
ncbi:hypothetical protein CU633_15270 [Bacillus sp. V3-13]|uniref:SbcC/MukB-like Walker B domain-containing protein n=1 Tax=Bacillus sp. V3-13 TaxID=2053728 RepID=UPI000C78CCB2|nr:AAA family ATPase [Bacillus sp. V3-13]PLR76549.1 hypothetical protein CU633_15270 [Bacillus sp. V3-13]